MKILVFSLVVLFVYVIVKYNSIVNMKNKIKQAESGIDVYLTQRFNLIPNLVEYVKGYMIYENEVLNKITEQRAKYFENKSLKDGETLNIKCNQIMLKAESYPELKASEQFLNLQKNLSKMESQLQAARRIYNAEVNVYNTCIEKFPTNVIAKIFRFTKEKYFEAEEENKNNTKVDL